MKAGHRAALLALLAALAGCDDGPAERPAPTIPITTLLGTEASPGYARAMRPRPLEFPADHGSHPEYRTEWWYFTGNLAGPGERHYGFQLTFFRFALAPGGPQRASAWATRNAWMAHFAVTDTDRARLIAEERFAREALALAGAESSPFSVWVHDWSAREEHGETFRVRLSAAAGEIGLDLSLTAVKPPIPHGDAGLDRKGPEPGQASYYYSLSRLTAEGRIRTNGLEQQVAGTAWLDHEWSSAPLDDELEGWDWFAVQLSDGRELMFYRMRRSDGSDGAHSSGALIDASGERQPLSVNDVSIEALRNWRSPDSDVVYPIAWRLDVPDRRISLMLEPYVDAQEIDLSVRYWEGAARVRGREANTPLSGTAYVELTGY